MIAAPFDRSLTSTDTCSLPLDNVDPVAVEKKVASSSLYIALKRVLDIVVVLLASPGVLIVIALAALAILAQMGRPVFFTQPRVGLRGRPFKIVKLRTMRSAPAGKTDLGATAVNDARITRLGKILRLSHIDELPQMWNVLCGEMTLVGPRPEQVHLVETYRRSIQHYDLRHTVRPGLSGWAQIRFGYAANEMETKQKLQYDLYYISRVGPLIDLKVLGLTIVLYLNPKYVR